MPRRQLQEAPGALLQKSSGADALSLTSQPLTAVPFGSAVLVQTSIEVDEGIARLKLDNAGLQAVRLSVHSHHLIDQPPTRFDLMPGQSVSADIPAAGGIYDIAVHGPEGFLRTIAGDTASKLASFAADLTLSGANAAPGLLLELTNGDRITRVFEVSSRIGPTTTYRIAPGASQEVRLQPSQHDVGWYDLTVTVEGVSSFSRRFAGHLANARPASSTRIGDS